MSLQASKLINITKKLNTLTRQLGTAAAKPNRNPKIEYTQVK